MPVASTNFTYGVGGSPEFPLPGGYVHTLGGSVRELRHAYQIPSHVPITGLEFSSRYPLSTFFMEKPTPKSIKLPPLVEPGNITVKEFRHESGQYQGILHLDSDPQVVMRYITHPGLKETWDSAFIKTAHLSLLPVDIYKAAMESDKPVLILYESHSLGQHDFKGPQKSYFRQIQRTSSSDKGKVVLTATDIMLEKRDLEEEDDFAIRKAGLRRKAIESSQKVFFIVEQR